MGPVLIPVLSGIVALVLGIFAGYLYRKNLAEKKIGQAEETVVKLIEDAQKRAENIRKETVVEAKEEVHKLRNEFDKETKERRNELTKMEKRLLAREEALDKKNEQADRKNERLDQRLKEISQTREELRQLQLKEIEELEKITDLTTDQAKEILLEKVEEESRHDMAILVRDIEAEAKEEADRRARNIISLAIQRVAADHVAETTISVVPLPNDEMKGRIIGREGRNIRALETATGVELVVDDTPEAVVLTGFDPVRREVARIALERLIVDGRIHPARIEETVNKARKEVEASIKEAGEQAVLEAGIHNLHPELVKTLGRLKYRFSYGQNVLKHSLEVAHLAGIMADEIGADSRIAKRAGLLHDIGKAITHEQEGSHAKLGADMAEKYKENAQIVNAIAAHHGDVEPKSIEAVLVQAADAISAARPGARREALDNYVKRLESLEEIANSFKGVEKSFAIQAGREIRIIVKPEEVDEPGSVLLAREIAKKIESDLEYPGQIKVNVIRETRVVDYAK
ncbi:MAG: ribonuclease Y [Clostridia bacterium]|nr:ribonuclease Y [Clostridia bacterium]